MKKEDSDIHNEMVDEAISGKNSSNLISGPLKIILGLFLAIIIVLWLVPYYYIKDNPHPKYIPEIEEVYSEIHSINRTNVTISSTNQYLLFVDSTNPDVKAVADKISSMACDYSENYIICQSKALYYFVRDNFNYVKDPASFEYVKGPLESLNNLGGDCDDASVLLASMLGSIGIKTRLVFVPNHVYVEAYLPEASVKYKVYKNQDWVAMDATCKNCEFGDIPLSDRNADKRYLSAT